MARHSRIDLGLSKAWPTASLASNDILYPQNCTHVSHVEIRQHTIHENLDKVPYLVRSTCDGYVCQHDIYAQLSTAFAAWDDVHGAIDVRVLLWGPAGCGKREISTHFARTYSILSARTILWVEASSPITFVRDMRLAYSVVTGEMHPSGVGVRWQMFRISQTLSQCKSKWFMVVFDLNSDLQRSDFNDTGIDLCSYLPDGQILVTYSPKPEATDNSTSGLDRFPLELRSQDFRHFRRVAPHNKGLVRAIMSKSLLPSSEALPCSDASMIKFSQHLLSAAIGTSIATMSNISPDQYQNSLQLRRLGSTSKIRHDASPASILRTFGSTMEMLLEVLRDIDSNAEELLVLLSPACARDIPLRLVQKLNLFKNNSAELEDSLEILRSAHVISLTTLASGDTYINMHSMVHRWLNAKFRRPKGNGDPGYRRAIRQWVALLEHELPEIQQESHRSKYWMLLHLVLDVLKNAEHIDYRGSSVVCLLRKIAGFMSEFLVTPVEANRLLARALFLTADLQQEDAEFSIELERLKLHCERSKLCALLGDYPQARQEVDYAQSCLSRLKSPDDRGTLQHNLNEDLIELLVRQGNHVQARLMINNVLATNPSLPSEKIGKLHYWAVCCAGDDRVAHLTALQHSHSAMSYWQTLPENERWGSKSFSLVAWVDAHTDLLLQMDRGRGALVFLPKLLDHYIEQCPPGTEAIWRVAYCLVRENIGVVELEAAEKVACRVLSIYDFTRLDPVPLAWALTMLQVLGAMFARTGRYLESEGIFRTCLTAIEKRRPPRVSGHGDFSALNLWLELCHTLLVQGKIKKAESARAIAIVKGYDKLAQDDWKKFALEPRQSLQKAYDRTFQAALDRRNEIYNPDDCLLDVPWPKTFSIVMQVLGSPIERIENGFDSTTDILIPTSETLGEWSIVLEILGYHFDASDSDTSSKAEDDQSDWYNVFETDLAVVGDEQQQKMDDYWRWCNCRRKRKRTSSIGFDMTFHNRIARDEEARKEKGNTKDTKTPPKRRQRQITELFPRLQRYAASCCPPECPCVKANAASEGFVSELESSHLHVWRSSNAAEAEAKHDAYLRALKLYRYRFGPRPAVPYGMSFITRWRRPKGPTEPNGEAKKQHEFFWAPDFVFSGDSEANWGFLGQDENYLLSHPAMTIRADGQPGGLPDLPNIMITSYKLGEEVRGNIDLFQSQPKRTKKTKQTNIQDYLDEEEDQPIRPDSDAPVDRPRRRRGRIPHRIPLPISRSASESSSVSAVRSRSRSRSRSPDKPIDQARNVPLDAKQKLNLFSIKSVGAIGPAFSTDNFLRMDNLLGENENDLDNQRNGQNTLIGNEDTTDQLIDVQSQPVPTSNTSAPTDGKVSSGMETPDHSADT